MTAGHPLARFRQQALAQPDAIAVVDGEETISYGQLADDAVRIAGALSAAGVQPGDRVAIYVPKSIDAVTTFLACLSLGAPYVPIDLSSPPARVAAMMTVAEPIAAIAHPKGRELLDATLHQTAGSSQESGPWTPAIVDLAAMANQLRDDSGAATPAETLAVPDLAGLAHLLFTSGSTGQPKGVAVSVANVAHFVDWSTSYFAIAPGDRVSGHAPFHFDLSTFDIFGALCAGAELHLVPAALNLLPHKLAEWIRERELTQWFSVPTVLAQLVNTDVVTDGDFSHLRHLLWCGEAIATPVLRQLMARLPHVIFTNLYGPTETTIASSVHRMTAIPESDLAPVSIGVGIPGETLTIRSEHGQVLAADERGEICVEGLGVTDGYWRDPDKTAAAFRTDFPRSDSADDGPVYRTGDVGYHNEGLFYVLGRLDNQIKFRGHRIELGEIEAALLSLPEVEQVAVVFPELERPAIAAAVVAPGAEPAALRKKVAEIVPGYMVPGRWELVDSLATNANGKTDRRAVQDYFEENPAQ